MKILWLTNIPSPYRIDFFNELGKKCELTVLFEKQRSNERDKSWDEYKFNNFKGIFLKGISYSVDSAVCLNIIKYLKRNRYDNIVVSNLSTPTGIIAIEYMKLFKIKYSLETDGGFAKSGKGIKEKYKKHLIKNAQIYFSTSKENDKYYLQYGANKEKIVRYPFTSIKEKDIIKQLLPSEEKEELKKELKISEEKVILSVGRFIYGKGYDLLIKASKEINKNIGIYIIGGKATKEYLELKGKCNASNVHFIDFKLKNELIKYYMCADIFVLPTRGDVWGLVINEAMANGLPVITTNKCIAGLELVQNEENGYIVEADNIKQLNYKMKKIINSVELKNKMSKNNLDKIKKYTIENMAKKHISIFQRGKK